MTEHLTEYSVTDLPVYEDLTRDELTAMLEDSHQEYLEGNYNSLDDTISDLNKKYNINIE